MSDTLAPSDPESTPAPGIWVAQVWSYETEDDSLDSHSVTIFPTRAEAVAWVCEILDDERAMYDPDEQPLVEESHEQPYLPYACVTPGTRDPIPDHAHWRSEWTVFLPESIAGCTNAVRMEARITQGRFGLAYPAF